jgi:hypothetical protein
MSARFYGTLCDLVFLPYTTGMLIVALLVTGVVSRARNDQRNGLMVGLAVWAFALLLTALPVLTYAVDYSPAVDLFIAACLAAATIGYNCVRKTAIQPLAKPSSRRDNDAVIKCLGWIGIVGNCLVLLYAVQRGANLNPASLLSQLSSIRQKTFELTAVGVHGVIGVVGTLLAPASYLYLITARLKDNRLLAATNFALIVFVAFAFYAARQPIFVAVMLVVIALWVRGVKVSIRPRTIVMTAIALAGVWYFTTSFVAHRQKITDVPLVLHIVSHAKYGPWTEKQAYANPTIAHELLQFSYFSSPIPALMYYLESGVVPKPLGGAYSFPLPYFVVGIATHSYSRTQWADARAEVFRPFSSNGYLDNAWATILRDLVADFGKIGTIAFCLLLGAFMAWARNRYEDTGDVFYHALEVYATITFTLGAFYSLLYPDFMANGFFLAWGLVIVRHLLSPVGSRQPRPRSRMGFAK